MRNRASTTSRDRASARPDRRIRLKRRPLAHAEMDVRETNAFRDIPTTFILNPNSGSRGIGQSTSPSTIRWRGINEPLNTSPLLDTNIADVPGDSRAAGIPMAYGTTNRLTNTHDFAVASWIYSDIVSEGSVVGPDGSTINSLTFRATAPNGTLSQASGLTAITTGRRVFSAWIRRVTGSGQISMCMDTATANYEQIAPTSTWKRFWIHGTATTATPGIRIGSQNDVIAIAFPQLDADQTDGVLPYPEVIGANANVAQYAQINPRFWFQTSNRSRAVVAEFFPGFRNVLEPIQSVFEIRLSDDADGYIRMSCTRSPEVASCTADMQMFDTFGNEAYSSLNGIAVPNPERWVIGINYRIPEVSFYANGTVIGTGTLSPGLGDGFGGAFSTYLNFTGFRSSLLRFQTYARSVSAAEMARYTSIT